MPFGREDFQQLIDWLNEEYMLINWSGNLFRFPLNEESLEWYIKDTNNPVTADAYVFKAVDTETGLTAGHISLGGISHKNKSARISRVLVGNTSDRGKGTCQAMVKAVCKIAFEDLKLHRVSIGVYDTNKAAVNCYEKAGFKIEGINRDILWYNNEWLSMIEMSILEQEWRLIS